MYKKTFYILKFTELTRLELSLTFKVKKLIKKTINDMTGKISNNFPKA